MNIHPRRAAVLALHWQVNGIKPEGFFGAMLAEPVARSGAVGGGAGFPEAACLPVSFTRFTVPEGEGGLVRNAGSMGFAVHVVSDCVTAADDAVHAASLANLEL